METKKHFKPILFVIIYAVWESLIMSCFLFLSLSYALHHPKIIGYILSEYTGKSIKIQDVKYDFNLEESSVCLTIEKFEMYDEKYGELQDLIISKNTVIDISIQSLFADTVLINNISFYGTFFNVNLFEDGDTYFDKYLKTEPDNLNVLIHNCELDSCYISYNNYESHIDDYKLGQVSEYQISVFINYAKFEVFMFIEDTKDCLDNNYFDTYSFVFQQCNGNLLQYRYNNQEIDNRKFEIFNSELKYIYHSEPDNYIIHLDIPDTAYFGDILFSDFILTYEDSPNVFSGEIYGDICFPLISSVCSDISEILEYDIDSLLLAIVANSEINSELQNFRFYWEYNKKNNFEKLFFQSDCALSGTTDDCFFNLKGLKEIDSEFCLVYSYNSIAGEERDSVIIKDLNIKALNSIVRSNKGIVLSNINSNSELDIDISCDVDLSYLKQFLNIEIIEELSGRLSTKSVRVKALLNDFSIAGLSKIFKKIEIENAQINSANLKIRDFSSEFKYINATLNLINSVLNINESNFIYNDDKIFSTIEVENINNFFSCDSMIKSSAFIRADKIDLSNLFELFKNDNNENEKSEDSQTTFFDRLDLCLSFEFDSIIYQQDIMADPTRSMSDKIKKQIDDRSNCFDSVLPNSISNRDIKVTDFISDIRFFSDKLILSNCSFNMFGAKIFVSGVTIFDSILSSEYLINLRNINSYKIESESGLSIADFINFSGKIYPYIDSISANIEFSYEDSKNVIKIVIPESSAYIQKIDCFSGRNLTGSDSIIEYNKKSLKELGEINSQQYDSNLKHEAGLFSIGYGKLDLYIDSLFLIKSASGINLYSDTLLNLMSIYANPIFQDKNLSIDKFKLKIFDGIFSFNNVEFNNDDQDIFDLSIDTLCAESISFSDILIFTTKSGFIADKLYNKIFSIIKDFEASLSGYVSAKDVEQDINDLSLDWITETSEFKFKGSLSDILFSYNGSVKKQKTDFENYKNGKLKNRKRILFNQSNKTNDVDSTDGFAYLIEGDLTELSYCVISDSIDVSAKVNANLSNAQFELNYVEGEKYSISAKNIKPKEFLTIYDSAGSEVDLINNLNISSLEISSDSCSQIRMSIKLDPISFEVPRIINGVMLETGFRRLSNVMEVGKINLSLTMVDSVINEHNTVPKIILDTAYTTINDCYRLAVWGEYFEKTLDLKLCLFPIKALGKVYLFNVDYKDGLITVRAEGMDFLNYCLQKFFGKHEKYIIETLDTTYEEFREINKANKKFIKKEKKNIRKEKRKNKRNNK